MSQSLSTIALDVTSRYSEAGDALGSAYRAGVARAARAIEERFAAALQGPALPLFDDGLKQRLIDAHKQVSGSIAGGLIAGSGRACELRERLATGVKSGIERVAADADSSPLKSIVQTWAAVTLPSAQVSLAVANAIADGAKRLDARIAEPQPAVEAVEPAPARKRAAKR